jgi:hypothetical protein
MSFRFEIGDRVRVLTHPAQRLAVITGRWAGDVVGDTYGDNVYAVSTFVTLQRESSLAAEGFVPLSLDALGEWRMAGHGTFRRAGPSMVESDGGPGILWYPRLELTDCILVLDWRLANLLHHTAVPPHPAGSVLSHHPTAAVGARRDGAAAATDVGVSLREQRRV